MIVRTLLSEGRILYEVVEKQEDGSMGTRRIEIPGPTGLITTTTRLKVHPENETRLLSIPIDDTAAQTKAIMQAIASGRRTSSRRRASGLHSRPGSARARPK